MGMTDRQFDAYNLLQLLHLEEIQDELAEKGIHSKKLDRIIENLSSQLKRP